MPTLTGFSCADAPGAHAIVVKSATDTSIFLARVIRSSLHFLLAVGAQTSMSDEICQYLYLNAQHLGREAPQGGRTWRHPHPSRFTRSRWTRYAPSSAAM